MPGKEFSLVAILFYYCSEVVLFRSPLTRRVYHPQILALNGNPHHQELRPAPAPEEVGHQKR